MIRRASQQIVAITLPTDFTVFAFKNPLFWLYLCLGSVVVYTCSVHSYVSTQKLVRIAREKRKNILKVDHTIALIQKFFSLIDNKNKTMWWI